MHPSYIHVSPYLHLLCIVVIVSMKAVVSNLVSSIMSFCLPARIVIEADRIVGVVTLFDKVLERLIYVERVLSLPCYITKPR